MDVGLVALVTGIALICALVWIWVPYLTRRPKPQHSERHENWNWPHRMPLPPEKPPVHRFGRLPETWDEYRGR